MAVLKITDTCSLTSCCHIFYDWLQIKYSEVKRQAPNPKNKIEDVILHGHDII